MPYTFVGLGLLLALLFLIFKKHPRTISDKKRQTLQLESNGDMDKAYGGIEACAVYVDEKYTARCKRLLARFNEVYLQSFQYSQARAAIEKMYGLKKTLHKALLDVRYRLPQDAKMVRRLNEASELVDYAIRKRITDAEARAKYKPNHLPLGCYDYGRYVRASNDLHVVDKLALV
jgi:hypothetical protein